MIGPVHPVPIVGGQISREPTQRAAILDHDDIRQPRAAADDRRAGDSPIAADRVENERRRRACQQNLRITREDDEPASRIDRRENLKVDSRAYRGDALSPVRPPSTGAIESRHVARLIVQNPRTCGECQADR